MAALCMTDMRTNTSKNITRICAEYGGTPATITAKSVAMAAAPRPVLPDDMWKLDHLREMLDQWQELRVAGREGGEEADTLALYISILCEM